ncbi:hypothetical protein [Streptomyces sp. enrichment culture]|uniref:hypothetical protein n=1 Tax=Streptomyces sp. enrichment culture TaxID=1795815 RepID=UPI003F55C94B
MPERGTVTALCAVAREQGLNVTEDGTAPAQLDLHACSGRLDVNQLGAARRLADTVALPDGHPSADAMAALRTAAGPASVLMPYQLVRIARTVLLGQVNASGGLPGSFRRCAVYDPQRTWAAVRAVCRSRGEREFADWLAERREQERHFGDLKRADALAAVRGALAGTTAATSMAAAPPPGWETAYFRRWSNAVVRQRVDGLELSTEDRLAYQQVFDPAFRDRWAAYLEHLSRHPAGGGPGLPLAERLWSWPAPPWNCSTSGAPTPCATPC